MIADPELRVANLYGMIHPHASDRFTVRSVFVIDPKKKNRLILNYPASTVAISTRSCAWSHNRDSERVAATPSARDGEFLHPINAGLAAAAGRIGHAELRKTGIHEVLAVSRAR